MKEREREMVERNMDLIFKFEKYILEHSEFAEKIPQEAVISLQVEGDEEFNHWCQELAKSQVERGQSIIYIKVKRLGPVRSRIEELGLEGVTP